MIHAIWHPSVHGFALIRSQIAGESLSVSREQIDCRISVKSPIFTRSSSKRSYFHYFSLPLPTFAYLFQESAETVSITRYPSNLQFSLEHVASVVIFITFAYLCLLLPTFFKKDAWLVRIAELRWT